jgi:hypothetical protein
MLDALATAAADCGFDLSRIEGPAGPEGDETEQDATDPAGKDGDPDE